MSFSDMIGMLQEKFDDLRYMLMVTKQQDVQLRRILKHAKELPPSLVWITKDWWKYVVEHVELYNNDNELFFFQHMWCRATGHPCGVWWYNMGGYEPDMHCQYCNDDLG